MKPHQLRLLRTLVLGSPSQVCGNCALRVRQFHALRPLLQEAHPQTQPPPPPPSPQQEPPKRRLAPSQEIHSQHNRLPTTPSGHWKHPGYIEPLGRPIGHGEPPHIHDNAPIDTRDLGERYKDFTDKQKHLQKREKIKSALARPYFRDWKNLTFASGKLWLANEKLWRGEMSLWMPNLVGDTLAGEPFRATTEVLRGRVSLVALFQRDWAQKQTENWYSLKGNPQVAELVEAGRLNLVSVNVEEAPLARSIQNFFRWFIRRGMSRQRQQSYFFVNQVPDSVVEEIGLLNSRVGYVYLVDEDCKIRWAGCADGNDAEKEALAKGAERLVKLLEQKRQQLQ